MARRFILAFAMLASAACRTADPYNADDPRPQGAMLEVKNQFFNDIDVYALGDGLATRIGTVTGNSTGRFALSESLRSSSNLQFIGTPIGGNGRAASGLVHANGGETITFIITSTLRGNSVFVHQ